MNSKNIIIENKIHPLLYNIPLDEKIYNIISTETSDKYIEKEIALPYFKFGTTYYSFLPFASFFNKYVSGYIRYIQRDNDYIEYIYELLFLLTNNYYQLYDSIINKQPKPQLNKIYIDKNKLYILKKNSSINNDFHSYILCIFDYFVCNLFVGSYNTDINNTCSWQNERRSIANQEIQSLKEQQKKQQDKQKKDRRETEKERKKREEEERKKQEEEKRKKEQEDKLKQDKEQQPQIAIPADPSTQQGFTGTIANKTTGQDVATIGANAGLVGASSLGLLGILGALGSLGMLGLIGLASSSPSASISAVFIEVATSSASTANTITDIPNLTSTGNNGKYIITYTGSIVASATIGYYQIQIAKNGTLISPSSIITIQPPAGSSMTIPTNITSTTTLVASDIITVQCLSSTGTSITINPCNLVLYKST